MMFMNSPNELKLVKALPAKICFKSKLSLIIQEKQKPTSVQKSSTIRGFS